MTDYYVKSYANGGRDSHTGDSHEQAWETIAKVNSFSFNTGDCVYFLCGDTWLTRSDSRLVIDWGGSGDAEVNRAIVGTYYMDGESEIVGVNVDGKPIIDGGWDLSTFEGAERRNESQIRPYGVDFLTIQDIHIRNSHGQGIYNGYDAQSAIGYITYRNILVEDTGRAGLVGYYCGNHVLIEYCKVMRDNRQFFIKESPNWDSGIRWHGDYGIGRYNEVGNGWGEGIGLGHRSHSHATIENNLVWGRQSVGIYLDAGIKDTVVQNNVVVGTTNTDYHKTYVDGGRTWNPCGIGLNAEAAAGNIYTLRNKIYNNVIIGCHTGIQALNQNGLIVGEANRHFAYNNTLIDNWRNIWTHVSEEMDTEYKNNLSYLSSEATTLGCKHVFYYANVGPTDVYRPLGNFWSSTPQHAAWEHASDVVGDPKFTRTSGWLSISEPSDIDIAADIAISSDSAAIDSALNLGDTYDQAFIGGCDFNTPDASAVATPIIVVTGDQDSYGTGWDFGARIFTGTVIRGAGILALM